MSRRSILVVLLAVVAAVGVAAAILRPWEGDSASPPQVVVGPPEGSPEVVGSDGEPASDSASGNRCFRPTYLPAGMAPELLPGPALAGGPMVGSRDEVSHWGMSPESIDVAASDNAEGAVPGGGRTRFPVLDAEANAGVIFDSGGGIHEWVAFPACERWWVLSSTRTDDGRGTAAGQVRRVAEGLVPGDPAVPERTGVTGILFAYAKPDPEIPSSIHGPVPGSGATSGRVKAVSGGAEVARVDVPADGRFILDLSPGEYDIVATFERDDRLCGQQRVTVVQHRMRSLTFTCQR